MENKNNFILTKTVQVPQFIFEAMQLESKLSGQGLSDLATQAWVAFMSHKLRKQTFIYLETQQGKIEEQQ